MSLKFIESCLECAKLRLLACISVFAACSHAHGTPVCRDYDDSKVLSADQRDQLYKAIGEDDDIVFSTCSLSAQHISRSMLATHRTSLNELAAQATIALIPVSYTHLRAHETSLHLVCRLLLEKKKR